MFYFKLKGGMFVLYSKEFDAFKTLLSNYLLTSNILDTFSRETITISDTFT